MRRRMSSNLKRFSCRIGVGASLLLAVLLAALWVRSYWKADLLTDWFFRPSGDHVLNIWPLVRSERGGISFRVKTSHVAGPPRPSYRIGGRLIQRGPIRCSDPCRPITRPDLSS